MREPVARGNGPGRRIAARLGDYGRLMRLDRPIGIWLLMWPTLWALWVAGQGHPRPDVFLVFVAGVVLMRSAGCVINDFADRDIDPHVERTAERPLARGDVTTAEALLLSAGLGGLAFCLVLTMNRLTVLLALAGAVLTVVYPFLKRFSQLPQVWLGAAFGWSVPMAFAAQTGAVPGVAWLMFLAVVVWAVVYDTMYAMVDRDDDRKLGVGSTAILFGEADRRILGAMQVVLLAILWLTGRLAGLGGWYLAGLAVAAGLAVWQQVLIQDRDRARCFRAFLNNHYFGMAIFVGILLDYTFRGA